MFGHKPVTVSVVADVVEMERVRIALICQMPSRDRDKQEYFPQPIPLQSCFPGADNGLTKPGLGRHCATAVLSLPPKDELY